MSLCTSSIPQCGIIKGERTTHGGGRRLAFDTILAVDVFGLVRRQAEEGTKRHGDYIQ